VWVLDYIEIRSWPVVNGENFTEQDVRTANKVALIRLHYRPNLVWATAIQWARLSACENVPFTIVGLLASKGMNMMGSDQDDILLVPYTSAMKRLSGGTSFRSLNVQAESAGRIAEIQEQITNLLRQRHRIAEGRDDDFLVRTQQEISEMATSTSVIMTWLLGVIASVSLLVGGIGIMNIMLVSVTERTREIGIRMAVGARGGDIMMQFLIEAVLLSIVGG